MAKKKNNNWILVVIFLIACILRLYSLDNLPNGFHVDELDAGYIGRYILIHGKDVAGNVLPLVYNKFGDFRPTGIFYLSGLSTFLFGVNEFAVRFPSAFIGALTVIIIYYLGRELFDDENVGLLSSFALALLPWHIVLSRATSEAVVGLFFIICGLLLEVRGIRGRRTRELFVGGIFFLLSYFFYHSFRFLVPLIIFPFIFYPRIEKREKIKILFFFLLSVVLTIVLALSAAGGGRFSQVAFYKNPILPNTFKSMEEGEGPGNILRARLFHNKAVIYFRELLTQYVSYFSPGFLLINGGLPDRYVVPEQGLLPIVLGAFLGIGLLGIFDTKHKWLPVFLVVLILVAPLPAAVTFEDAPNVHRSIVLILPVVLLVGFGFSRVLTYFRNKKFGHFFSLAPFFLLVIELIYFWHQYSVHAGSLKGFLRNDGLKKVIQVVLKNREDFDTIYMPIHNEFTMFYLFYSNNFQIREPSVFHIRTTEAKIDNIVFLGAECPYIRLKPDEMSKHILVVAYQGCAVPDNFSNVYRVARHDGTEAYTFLVPKDYGKPLLQ